MAKKSKSKAQVLKLKQQLSGKPTISTAPKAKASVSNSKSGYQLPTQFAAPSQTMDIHADTAYLNRDLTKIAILSTLAIGIQLGLFFALRNGLTISGF